MRSFAPLNSWEMAKTQFRQAEGRNSPLAALLNAWCGTFTLFIRETGARDRPVSDIACAMVSRSKLTVVISGR